MEENVSNLEASAKVLMIPVLSLGSMEILDNVLVLGQPYINGLIGIFTVIYLIKRIFEKKAK